MWQSWENTKTYELKDCTVDELIQFIENKYTCLLYTSDAADEL